MWLLIFAALHCVLPSQASRLHLSHTFSVH
jgi:hypothetical protein